MQTITTIEELQNVQLKCSIRDLSVLAYANGFTMWHYKANALADMMTENYFLSVYDMLAVGDLIIVTAKDGVKLFHVVAADLQSVVVAQT